LKELYVIRGKNDRITTEDNCISEQFADKKSDGEIKISVPGNGKRKNRNTTLEIKFIQTTLKKTNRHSNAEITAFDEIPITVIWAKEATCPLGQIPINCVLFTNCPVKNIMHAQKCLEWYKSRWRIEEYHKVLKAGCNAENCYLQTFERINRFVSLMSVVAYRLYWLTLYNRANPNRPYTDILYTHEMAALYTVIKKKKLNPKCNITVKEATIMIAKLGGFLNRVSDGNPGITVMWRGWQKLQDLVQMWSIVNEISSDKSCG
jgi:transposase